MSLDPDARALLDRVAAAGIRPWHTHAVEDARRVYAERIRLLDPRPIEVQSVTDRHVPGGAGELPARVYRPEADARLPTVLYLHGGGWVLGSLESHDWICREIAAAAHVVVVSLAYRLAPEHPHPAALEDALAAATWLSDHAADIGGDGRLVTAGDSAGGHLSAALALLARDQAGPHLDGQVLIYPALAPEFDSASYRANADGYLLTRGDLLWFWGHLLAGATTDGYEAPGRAVNLADLPPALVVTAGFDPLRDEGRDYAQRLADAGVSTTLLDYPEQIHGFVALPDAIPAGRTAVTAIAAWLAATFERAPSR
jgi:acetyl esterase